MATLRPTVSIYSPQGKVEGSALMPSVCAAPLRPDLVRYVFTNMSKNHRQAYGVAPNAGYQTSAESWGTGRAVSRIPRVQGGGTHRAGQAAFGNQCRGGGMFAPNKTWRRWHRHINVTEKRHAICTAIAASCIPALVAARGHMIEQVPELPLIVNSNKEGIQSIKKTKQAVDCLKQLGLYQDVQRVVKGKKITTGRGKSRNRRYALKRGPLIIYGDADNTVSNDDFRAFRNIPGVEMCNIHRLNLLKLAPGGNLGRLCVWTDSAFKHLQMLYGRSGGFGTAALKKGYHIQRPMMTNADLARIINSNEIQSITRPIMKKQTQFRGKRIMGNPLKNPGIRGRVNPTYGKMRKMAKLLQNKTSKVYQKLSKTKQQKTLEKRQNRKLAKAFVKTLRA